MKKEGGKDNVVNFTFRIDRGLKDTFVRVCKNNDEDASKVIRRLIREYLKNNSQGGLIS